MGKMKEMQSDFEVVFKKMWGDALVQKKQELGKHVDVATLKMEALSLATVNYIEARLNDERFAEVVSSLGLQETKETKKRETKETRNGKTKRSSKKESISLSPS